MYEDYIKLLQYVSTAFLHQPEAYYSEAVELVAGLHYYFQAFQKGIFSGNRE